MFMGWVIAIIVLGLVLLSLMLFEYWMTYIYIKTKIFNKIKYTDKIFIVDYILLFVCLVISILLTVFYTTKLEFLSAVIVWWIIIIIYLCLIGWRFYYVNILNKKSILPSDCLNMNIDILAKKLNINIDYNQYLNLTWKPDYWIDQIKYEYELLKKQTLNITKTTEQEKISNLLASIIVFYEKNILKLNNKKRKFVSALTLDLLKNLQINISK